MSGVENMAYRQPIIDRLDRQTGKGIAKYGDTICRSGHLRNGTDRLEYLAEELTDALVYIEDAKANSVRVEQLLEEVSNERAVYKAELEAIREILMTCWHHSKPIDKVKGSRLTLNDLTEIRALVSMICIRYETERRKVSRLIAK